MSIFILKEILDRLLTRGQTRVKVRGDFLHKHRIIPGFEGGTYNPSNISLLTRKEHRIVHKIRWKLYGHVSDKIASNWLSSKLTEEDVNRLVLEGAKLGGKITSAKMKENKAGIFGRSKEKMSEDGRKAQAALVVKLYGENYVSKKSLARARKGKPRPSPPNKTEQYCVGCRQLVQPSRLMRNHRQCWNKFIQSC